MLSVFRGGFDRQAAVCIAEADLPELSELLERSLLKVGGDGRFGMHALLRQYAAEKLEQSADLKTDILSRHCCYYLDLLTQREADFFGPKMLSARDEVRLEMENMRAAVNWACTHWEVQPLRRLLVTLLVFYTVQGWHEGITTFYDIARLRRGFLADHNLNVDRDGVILGARAHQAFLHSNLAQIEESEAICSADVQELEELGMQAELSECLHNLGVNASFRGQYQRARTFLEEAIRRGRECDHIVWPTYLLWLGHVYFLLGEYEQAQLSLRKCHELFERQENLWGAAFALSKLGLAADGLGEHALAVQDQSRALSIFEQSGNQAGRGYSLSRMSMSACLLEDYPTAVRLGQQGLQIFEELGHGWGICASQCRLGFAYLGLGEILRAKEYFSRALQQSRQAHMLPLSLYSLAGLACTLAQVGEHARAIELYRYVRCHPRTPVPYLQSAARWMGSLGLELAQEGGTEPELEPVEQVIERLLEPEFCDPEGGFRNS